MVNALLSAYEQGDITKLTQLLEKAALSASDAGDIAQFDKSYQQLRPIYAADTSNRSTTTRTTSSSKKKKNVITALHLLMLLSESSVSQFHSEIESLSETTLASPEIQWVNHIEQGIMEGSYQEVRNLLSRPPDQAFERWGTLMTESIRAEIAECSASAYASLPLVNLTTLLMLQNVKETEQFAGERGWLIKDGRVFFPKQQQQQQQDGHPTDQGSEAFGAEMMVDSKDLASAQSARELLIRQTLGYARELESIV